jgi:hypothetical protein
LIPKGHSQENIMPSTLEHIAVKSAGTAAGLRARAHGLTGVYNLLARDHAEAAALLERAKSALEPEKREDLWMEVRRQLLAHERAELSIVYPVLEENEATSEMARRHSAEAQALETAITKIDIIGYTGDAWSGAIESLITLVEEHAHEEETQFFPRAIEVLGKKAASELETPFAVAKDRFSNELDITH